MEKMESGRKIDSIIDYLEEHEGEAERLNVILDPILMVKATIAKTQSNIGIDDFFRGITERSEIVNSDFLVTLNEDIENLPTKFSPSYAESTIIPYIEDLNRPATNGILETNKKIKRAKSILVNAKKRTGKKYEDIANKLDKEYKQLLLERFLKPIVTKQANSLAQRTIDAIKSSCSSAKGLLLKCDVTMQYPH